MQFKYDSKVFNSFCNNIRYLEDVVIPDMKPQVIFVEDITHEWLEKRFGVEIDSVHVAPFRTLKSKNYFSFHPKGFFLCIGYYTSKTFFSKSY